MLRQIFNPDNFFFRGCNKLFDSLVLSALWLLLCLPLITLGPATAALYDVMTKCIRGGAPEPYRRFFRTFRQNAKVGALTGLIAVALCALLWLNWTILSAAAPTDTAATVWRAAYAVLLVVPLGAICYLFPLLSRFTFGVGGLLATALKLALRHLPTTVVLVLLLLEAAELCMTYLVPFAFAPAAVALLFSFFIERVFGRYSPPPQKPAP